ncbi:MAG: NO-inducible flavohemoprotein, partial [Gammaproteobacteria bacterium]|nr:NO-inducible flavohemoprotein [Gammaproteobacteria bacterium]
MLNTRTIEIVKSTIPLLENAGVEITDHFYKRMFRDNPELKDIFNLANQATGRQQFALFSAVAMYAKNWYDLGALGELVERVAQKHTSFDIQPDQYQIVGHHLIETLREMAPKEFTDEIAEAWIKAYGLLASVLIGREKEIYTEDENKIGGWTGPRLFNVVNKTKESELITSFIFGPADGGNIASYKPGQYIAVRVKPENSANVEIRQYSLSDKYNGETYRISVKKEYLPLPGLVSNYLHENVQVGDQIELMPPAGNFFLDHFDKPTILISAGVGITPMMAMLETLIANQSKQPILFLHASRNKKLHSYDERLKSVAKQYENINYYYWYSENNDDENALDGYMNLKRLELETKPGRGK